MSKASKKFQIGVITICLVTLFSIITEVCFAVENVPLAPIPTTDNSTNSINPSTSLPEIFIAQGESSEKQINQEPLSDDINLFKQSVKEGGGHSITNLLLSLSLVILLILITGWLYNKLSKINTENLFSSKINKNTDNRFRVISSLQLGQSKSIHLIEINQKQLIIGCTQNSMNLLSELNTEENGDFSSIFSNFENKTDDNDSTEDIIKTLFKSKEDEIIPKRKDTIRTEFINNEDNYKESLDSNIYKKYLNN